VYPVIAVNPQQAESMEQLGAKRKYWYLDGERRILFKAEERGTGEDWAEKLTCELASLLGLPHVGYELAQETGTGIPGVVCATCSPPPFSLVMGNQLLLDRDPDYPMSETYKVRQHTISVVAEVLSQLQLPPAEWMTKVPQGIRSATDVFIGYLMLDAWVANQDRHHQNWAALRKENELYLCPTFDHGSSMARNLTDAERSDRLTSKDVNRQVATFVKKARSAFYGSAEDKKALPTLEAWQQFAKLSPMGAEVWLVELGKIADAKIEELLGQVPLNRMSEVSRNFTRQLLVENRKRLLESGVL